MAKRMITWRRGGAIIANRIAARRVNLRLLANKLKHKHTSINTTDGYTNACALEFQNIQREGASDSEILEDWQDQHPRLAEQHDIQHCI